MIKRFVKFHLVLISTLLLSFFIHKSIFDSGFLPTLYVLNAVAAIFVYSLAYFFRNKHQEYLGYYFLAGTTLKFFIFFVFVLPEFKQDNIFTKEEFFSFFIPYSIALLVETTSLILLIKSTNKKTIKN